MKKTVLIVSALAVCAILPSAGIGQPATTIEFRLAEKAPAEGLTVATTPNGQKLYLHEKVVISSADIASVAPIKSSIAPYYDVEVIFTDEGAKKFAALTRENVNKYLAMFMNGELVAAPVIAAETPVTSGRTLIAGKFSEEEANVITGRMIKAY